MDGALLEGLGDGEAAAHEDVEHATVGGERPGLEAVVAEAAADDGEVAQEEAADTAALESVGDGEGDLGAATVGAPLALDGAADTDDALAVGSVRAPLLVLENRDEGKVVVEVSSV